MKIDEKLEAAMTEAVLSQFLAVRASGVCNMIDLNCVQVAADGMGLHALAALTKQEYLYLLRHFTRLLKRHDLSI